MSLRQTNEFIIKKNYAEMVIKSPKYGIKKVLIDIEDIEKCKCYKWHLRCGHMIYIGANSRKGDNFSGLRLSRYLMDCPKDLEVDHINRNTLDNRKSNLRCVNKFINARNKSFKENRNIYWNKNQNKYQVSIRFKNKNISGGYFDNIEEARIRAEELRKEYFGEDVCLI